jgi:hypothetical protein
MNIRNHMALLTGLYAMSAVAETEYTPPAVRDHSKAATLTPKQRKKRKRRNALAKASRKMNRR